jgi:hypothetical protein
MVVKSAAHVVTSTAQLRAAAALRKRGPSKFTAILNGYDRPTSRPSRAQDDAPERLVVPPAASMRIRDPCRAGRLHGGEQGNSTPQILCASSAGPYAEWSAKV